jgi:XTP/dITP diphosphohydrolase
VGAGPSAAGGGSPALGASLLRLVEVMDTLRVNCPWDARQTHESLAPHLLEECYEALEALESGEAPALADELGDVLLQVVFHARIASERNDGSGFTIDDVASGIVAKLVRRHPHVFADVTVSGPDEVKRNWDAIKAAERESKGGGPGSVVDSVPFGQPALALAAQLQRRAERAGAPPGLADLRAPGDPKGPSQPAPAGEPRPAGEPAAADGSRPTGEPRPAGESGGVGGIGAELFALVTRAREAGLDPELELRAAARAYAARVRAWERGPR